MKNAILFLFLMLASTLFINAQNAIAKLKFEEAEEAYSLSNFELTLSKLNEVESMLKSTNPKVLHLKILSEGQLAQTTNYQDDPELISQLKKDCDFYLTKYEGISGNEDKYREVYKVLETHKSPAYLGLYNKAQSGDIKAQVEMGDFYYEKKGLKKANPADPDSRSQNIRTRLESAILWYEKAANKGSVEAMYQLGTIYEFQKKDFVNTLKWYEMAAAKNCVKSMLRLGNIYRWGEELTSIDYDKAISWFKKAADLKSIGGMKELGSLYMYGKGTEINGVSALEWFNKAKQIAPQNKVDTVYLSDVFLSLTRMYYEGKAIEKNYVKAEENAMQGINFYKGHNSDVKKNLTQYYQLSIVILGNIYKSGGYGINQDYMKAFNYYTETSKGQEEAMIGLAEMYQKGLGIKKDKQKSLEWATKAITIYKASAGRGSKNAMIKLAEIYEGGIGVSEDLLLANEWRIKAAEVSKK